MEIRNLLHLPWSPFRFQKLPALLFSWHLEPQRPLFPTMARAVGILPPKPSLHSWWKQTWPRPSIAPFHHQAFAYAIPSACKCLCGWPTRPLSGDSFQFLREASPDEIKPSPLPTSYLPTYISPLSTPAAAGYPSLCQHPVHIQLSTKLQTPSGQRSSLCFHCCVLGT